MRILWQKAIPQAKEARKKIILQKKMPFYSLISFFFFSLICTEVYEALKQLLQKSEKRYPDFVERCWLPACLGLGKGEPGNQGPSRVGDFEWRKGKHGALPLGFFFCFVVSVLAGSQN